MDTVSEDEFEGMVQDALDGMPEQFMESLQNVAVVIADEPTDEELGLLDASGNPAGTRDGKEVLGLFTGIAITDRDFADYEGEMPDMITIFKGPHERCFHTAERIREEVKNTVIHEIGHYFGLDDTRLHEMGY